MVNTNSKMKPIYYEPTDSSLRKSKMAIINQQLYIIW